MAKEWIATCKDCGKEFGYSQASQELSSRRGLSRPERCPNCRQLHSREISTLGLSHYEMTPIMPIPAMGLSSGRLGGLIRPERVHREKEIQSTFDLSKFGIKDDHIREFFALMETHQVAVIVAPTGAGKSTFLPYRLMVPPEPFPNDLFSKNGQIIITQPRIQATRNIPLFVARDLHGSSLGAGFDVGFRHSGDPATDWRNKLVYMTDGSLINLIVRNELHRVSVIMIDEAHERSLNIDLILGLLKKELSKYPRLKLIIASATINADMFLNYFGGAEKVVQYNFPGKRKFPVETRFFDGEPIPVNQMSARMPEEVAKKALEILLSMEIGKNHDLTTMKVDEKNISVKGDILVFLQGEEPIQRAVKSLQEMIDDEICLAGKVDVLPLYTKLPQKAQDEALKPKKSNNRYRVVISTNVAETSLTVQGIAHVIDSGLINESQWDSETQTTYVLPKQHSQAGCIQRWGRAGRIQPGIAHCLYTEEQFEAFPEHTDPEIVRAPIDQIVLTAKAAGVDDIKKFDWIQRPKETELVRSPDYLLRIGALDEDGDLTEHGLEIRNFPESIDVANLMILADRFGCTVEMATLIPMMKLGGYTGVLLWNRGWDAPTKRAVHRIHEGLRAPCQDDIEFYLKLWAAWEGDLLGRKRKDAEYWAKRFFVNHNAMETVEQERKELLASLSGHKKEETFRPISLELLTRVRMVMVYGLGTQIYQLARIPNETNEEELVYHPYIKDPEAFPELVALHQDAVVEINPESICFGKFPEWFVCGNRKRLMIRKSPLLEPETIITASLIGLVKPEWLELIGKPLIIVAQMIAAEIRREDGSINQNSFYDYLFIDQIFPVGAMYNCALQDDKTVTIRDLQRDAFQIQARFTNEEVEVEEVVGSLEAEEALDQDAGVEGNVTAVVIKTDSATDLGELYDMEEDEEPPTVKFVAKNLQKKNSGRFAGQLKYSKDELPVYAVFNGIVVGYDYPDKGLPKIDIQVPIIPDPFEQFVGKYKVWQDIQVTVVRQEKYIGDWMVYLIVREVETGLEIVMDPYDINLIGRNFAVDPLSEIASNEKITVTIEDLDFNKKIVRVTRLKKSQEALGQLMKKDKKRTVDASIVDVRENGLYLWLDPVNTYDYSPCGAFVHFNRLIQRPDEMSLGQTCRVFVMKQDFRNPLRRSIVIDDPKLLDQLEKKTLPGAVQWDATNHVLSTKKPMAYDHRVKLLSISDYSAYQRAVNWLFRRSNELFIKILDISSAVEMAGYIDTKNTLPAKVVRLENYGIFVETDNGIESLIHRNELDYVPDVREISEIFEIGQKVDMYVKSVDMDEGKVEGSLLNPDQNPWLRYKQGQVVDGTVKRVLNYGVLVELTPGAIGKVPIDKASWGYIEDISAEFQVGQFVKVQIESIDPEERQAELNLKIPENDPLRKYRTGQIVKGTVVGFWKNDSGAFIELEKNAEGFLHVSEVSVKHIKGVQEVLTKGDEVLVRITDLNYEERKCSLTMKGIYFKELSVPPSHVGLVIGSKGSIIKKLQEDTQASIILEDDSGICRIEAPNKNAVNAGVRAVQEILQTQIVFCTLPNNQIAALIGKGGSTINRIQINTGSKIDIEGNSGKVTITAANHTLLQNTVDEINNVIGSYEVVIQVPPDKAHYIIGRGGMTIKEIREGYNVRVNLEQDIYKKFTGEVTIIGKKQYEVNAAISLIEEQVGGSSLRISTKHYALPQLTPVASDTPRRKSVERQAKPQEFAFRYNAPESNSKAISTPKAKKPTIFQECYQLKPQQVLKLNKRSGGLLSVLIGGNISPLDRIRQRTGARISIDTKNNIKIIASSQDQLDKTITLFKNELWK